MISLIQYFMALQPITLRQFLSRPDREDARREELIEGDLVLSPEPKPLHAMIVRRLQAALVPLEQHGFIIAGGFSCILADSSMPGPDLAATTQERWQEALDADGYLAGAPELAIEVRSPSNSQLGRKASLYLENGAEQVWVVYPKRLAIVVYDQDGMREVRPGEQLTFRGVILDPATVLNSMNKRWVLHPWDLVMVLTSIVFVAAVAAQAPRALLIPIALFMFIGSLLRVIFNERRRRRNRQRST